MFCFVSEHIQNKRFTFCVSSSSTQVVSPVLISLIVCTCALPFKAPQCESSLFGQFYTGEAVVSSSFCVALIQSVTLQWGILSCSPESCVVLKCLNVGKKAVEHPPLLSFSSGFSLWGKCDASLTTFRSSFYTRFLVFTFYVCLYHLLILNRKLCLET